MQTVLLVGVWLAMQASASSGDPMRIDWSRVADRDPAVAAVRAEYVGAINAHDAGGASAVYTEDALALFGDTEILRGRDALGERLQRGFERASGTVTLIPRSFATSNGLASETGTFTVSGSGDTPAVEGAYVSVYSRGTDGRWRIAMEIRTGASGAAVKVW